MTTVKATMDIDEETWNRFKNAVSSRQCSARNLSDAVEEALRSFDMEGLMLAFMEAMGIEAGRCPSLREVERSRPRLRTSASEKVRTMRGDRGSCMSGNKQPHTGRLGCGHPGPQHRDGAR